MNDDVKYLYASHKMEGFDTEPLEFQEAMLDFIYESFDDAWVLEAKSKKGNVPVGVVFSIMSGPVQILGEMTWFTWASKRNKVEAAAHFLNIKRQDATFLMYCDDKDKDFYIHLARHGLIRRIGKIEDPNLSLFQTRR
jgi:hypothetical protein